jgi:hypothetical protein
MAIPWHLEIALNQASEAQTQSSMLLDKEKPSKGHRHSDAMHGCSLL